ncbi:MAG: SusC/RagA family TonB-linked outer membrane protein, partial [Parapedobacter sp.]
MTLNVKQRPIPQVLETIESQTGYVIIYNDRYITQDMLVSLHVKDRPLEMVLDELLKPRGLEYRIKEKIIAIKGREPAVAARQQGQVTISGRVFEVSDPPIPLQGATVSVAGKSHQTVTDSAGNFQLVGIASDAKLVISMVGYKSQTYTIRGERTNLIFSLEKDLTAIEEVIVTGFSKQKRREIASSVSTVKMDNFTNKPITQLSQALQGGTTGITVQQQSGVVGSDQATIRIRGVATLNDASPLVVIDGIPGDMNNLDPNTVESINILKDAAAASMYGARGANGVIVITTKRGVAGAVNVDYNGSFGIQQPLNVPKFVDGPEYMQMRNQLDINEGRSPGFSEEAIRITREQSDPVNYPVDSASACIRVRLQIWV